MSDAARNVRQELEDAAAGLGAKAFGVADLEPLRGADPRLLDAAGPGFLRAVVLGLRLQAAVLDTIDDRPTPLYFHHYRQTNGRLDALAAAVADRIQDAGFRAAPVPASQIIGTNPMRGHLSHKHLGWAAGLGFIGRSTLLIHPAFGARMRYVSVLTDMPLEPGRPRAGGCGDCRRCAAACPAGAIRDDRKDFDLDACFRKLTEFSRLPFIGQHVCGVCVKACPGRRTDASRMTDCG